MNKTLPKSYALWTWLLASDTLSGYVEHVDNYCRFALCEFTEKEFDLVQKARKLLEELPDGASIEIPIEDSVIFIDIDVEDEEGVLNEIEAELEFAQSYVEANIKTDLSGYALNDNRFVIVSKNGVSFQLSDELGTECISWDELEQEK